MPPPDTDVDMDKDICMGELQGMLLPEDEALAEARLIKAGHLTCRVRHLAVLKEAAEWDDGEWDTPQWKKDHQVYDAAELKEKLRCQAVEWAA